jgi:hypothetical protein
MPKERNYTAIVQKVLPEGKHGPYAIAREANIGLITFSLDKPVWEEHDRPGEGTFVILTGVHKKRAGWRALHARFFRPEDQTSTENGASNG